MLQQQIATAILDHYGLQVIDLMPLSGGNDAYAQTFRASIESGEDLFLKLRPTIDPGVNLSAELHALGIDAVLAPIATNHDGIAAPVQDQFLLVYPFIQGTNGFERPLELDHWRQVGVILRQVHEANVSKKTLSHLRVEGFEVEGVNDFLAIRERLLAAPLNTVEEEIGQLAKDNAPYIERVLQGYELQGRNCREREWTFLPCHADLHIGNILIDTQGLVRLIDWDGPRLAPRECDLLFFCDGGIMKRHGRAEEAAFFTGYGDYQPDPNALRYFQFARDLEDFIVDCQVATNPAFTYDQQMEAVGNFRGLFRHQG